VPTALRRRLPKSRGARQIDGWSAAVETMRRPDER